MTLLKLNTRKLVNFIVLEGANKEFYWFALLVTLFLFLND